MASQAVTVSLLGFAGMALLVALAKPVHAEDLPAKKKQTAAATKARAATAVKTTSAAKAPTSRAPRKAVRPAPPVPSVGQLAGLHKAEDRLALKSAVALVIDADTDEVLFSKNPRAVLPIASITKLMTALVVVESGLPLDEGLVIGPDEVQATAASYSRRRLQPGTQLTRGELLRLALMASENRAAHALGRSYPGGVRAFVAAMNAKARLLGMHDTRYVEPTGLSSDNRSSAEDLARLVRAATEYPVIGEYSTTADAVVVQGRHQVQFRNTNALVGHADWEIAVQKTGYIAAAGRCVVMQTSLAGRPLILVLLDSAGRYSRIDDAERLRQWLLDNVTTARVPSSTAHVDAGAGADAEPAPSSVERARPGLQAQVQPR